jgi:hypothetical protein
LAQLNAPIIPVASVSHRLRPSPSPTGRVVKNGSKTRGSASAGIPGPLSCTASTPRGPSTSSASRSRRSAGGTCSSACSALVSRLWTICSSATGSASTVTPAAGDDTAGVTARRRQSGASRSSTWRTASSRRTGCTRAPNSGRSTARRSRPTTSPARRACRAAPTACALDREALGEQALGRVRYSTAVSGWLTSCAMPAAMRAR